MTSTRKIPTLAVLFICALSLSPGYIPILEAPRTATHIDAAMPEQTQPLTVKLKRLQPAAFPALPARIVRELTRRGCTIPQLTVEGLEMKEPHNVVSGEFARKGQKDWAVLCSRRGRSAIHIFWGGTKACAGVIGSEADNAARFIGTADAKYILEHYEAYGGTKPPPLDHLGINDGYAETASQVWYCYRGKWRVLQGAD